MDASRISAEDPAARDVIRAAPDVAVKSREHDRVPPRAHAVVVRPRISTDGRERSRHPTPADRRPGVPIVPHSRPRAGPAMMSSAWVGSPVRGSWLGGCAGHCAGPRRSVPAGWPDQPRAARLERPSGGPADPPPVARVAFGAPDAMRPRLRVGGAVKPSQFNTEQLTRDDRDVEPAWIPSRSGVIARGSSGLADRSKSDPTEAPEANRKSSAMIGLENKPA